jgi:hypothetical protein
MLTASMVRPSCARTGAGRKHSPARRSIKRTAFCRVALWHRTAAPPRAMMPEPHEGTESHWGNVPCSSRTPLALPSPTDDDDVAMTGMTAPPSVGMGIVGE